MEEVRMIEGDHLTIESETGVCSIRFKRRGGPWVQYLIGSPRVSVLTQSRYAQVTEQHDTLEELDKLTRERKAVTIPSYALRLPAAFVMNMQARQVLKYKRLGMKPYEKDDDVR